MRTLLILFLTVGCVPKKRFDAELDRADRTEAALAEAEEAIAAMKKDADDLEAALVRARSTNDELDSLADELDARTAAQAEQLIALSKRLASMTAVNNAQEAAKADLELLVSELQSKAGEAKSDADAARKRANELAIEREELAAEAARLAVEKAELVKKTTEYDALVGELESEIQAGEITITELSGKLTVAMSNAILFDSGATSVKKAGRDALAKVAGVLADVADREVRVEGHTDNVPVGAGASYPDNWALSALRASEVVRLLIDGGVDPLNVAAVGYGEFHPTQSNDTREGRAANRRTEIVLVPRLAPKGERPE